MANNFRNYSLKAVGTAAQNVYSNPQGGTTQTTVIGMTISNVYNSPIDASVSLSGGSHTGNVWLIKNATIAPGGSLVPVGGDQKLVVEAGDYIQVNTSVGSSADVILSVLEIS